MQSVAANYGPQCPSCRLDAIRSDERDRVIAARQGPSRIRTYVRKQDNLAIFRETGSALNFLDVTKCSWPGYSVLL